jgi:hypothetical protein
MVKGWDSAGTETKYIKGSRHNKIGMTIMWTYYVLFASMLIRSIIILTQRN